MVFFYSSIISLKRHWTVYVKSATKKKKTTVVFTLRKCEKIKFITYAIRLIELQSQRCFITVFPRDNSVYRNSSLFEPNPFLPSPWRHEVASLIYIETRAGKALSLLRVYFYKYTLKFVCLTLTRFSRDLRLFVFEIMSVS